MKRSNRLVILVGVLLAVLAFVAIVILLNTQRAPDAAVEPITETVLVATQDIAIGDSVTPEVVAEQQINPEAVQGTPLRSATAVSGQPALFPIPSGSQVTGEAIGLGTDRTLDLSAQLEPGEKAIAVQVDRVGGLDFLVQPGDVIDVVVAVQLEHQLTPDASSVRSAKAVLQSKRVLYVSTNRAQPPEPVDSDGDGVPDEQQPVQEVVDVVVIVFAGTDQDAELVRFAQRTSTDVGDSVASTLSVVLRHADDEEVEETSGITIQQLVEDYGVVVPVLDDVVPDFPNEEEGTDEEAQP